ncbi:MAG: phosphoribosylanthranilate isomerase [Pseudomonadota bacterium]
MRTRVKICCMANPGEADMAARAGADLIGLVGPMPSGPGVLTIPECAAIADSAPAWVGPVLLTSAETVDGLIADVTGARVRTVQIVRHVPPEFHGELQAALPAVRRIQVIHVEGGEALDLIDRYARHVDAFLLDSGRPSAAELGGTGRVHDWDVSAEFVSRSPVPVFHAGGLKPDNAVEAIRKVKPFGLDICSGVRTDDKLDEAKLVAFMAAVEGAAIEGVAE